MEQWNSYIIVRSRVKFLVDGMQLAVKFRLTLCCAASIATLDERAQRRSQVMSMSRGCHLIDADHHTTHPRRTHKKFMKLRQKQKLMNKKHQVLKKAKKSIKHSKKH
ncbi:hypothetical protein CY34DRAFT_484195 [Suillus luteus UH-Slu-Lm8-n1]|uniref:Unplaced genomic scaffold CY34scaffold_352, whole genome shotgun sequence n=1 Tax=Suillus luteus UH-Slu-Lm8-n1 TaxID=930992 RepID=A0A0D0A5Y8_9AGAM|nr:hypothetical protein CY34DRAFT_484195 [Suillus luteus UH-Slu-Lm8-n1]